MADAKRTNMKNKVSAAKTRNQARAEPQSLTDRAGEKAVAAKDGFTAFAKEHPVAIVAGGIAVGILVSGFFRGSPTRKAGREIGKRTSALAAMAAELAMAYGQSALEKAGEARQAGAEALGDWSEDAADYVSSARAAARKTGKSITQALRDRLN